MALSNMTHGAPGKAHGAGRSAPATGLEFLTGEGGDATGTLGKDGVDFSALMQGIIQPGAAPETAKAADAPLALPSDTVPQEPDTSAQHPDNAIALLTLALQNGGGNAPVVAQPVVPPVVNDLPVAQTQTKAPKDKGEANAKVGEQTLPTVHTAPLSGKAAIRRAASALAEGKTAPAKTEEDNGGKREKSEIGTAPVADAAPAQTVIAPLTQPATPTLAQAQAQAEVIRGAIQSPSSESGSGDRRRGDGRGKTEGVNATPAAPAGPDAIPVVLTSAKPAQPQADPVSSDASPAAKQTDGPNMERIVANLITNKNQKEADIKNYNVTGNLSGANAIHATPDAGADPVGLREAGEADSAALQADDGISVTVQTPRTDGIAQPTPQPAPASLSPATGATSIATTLGQQVVDMGVSGQWINDIARQIASISANPGHGSFRIASAELGAVRVDIAPASVGSGSDILMRVDNDAAFAALNDDKERLMQDARLASVRIGELRIDRVAPGQEAARGDMGNGQQQQQNPAAQQQGSQPSLSQNGAQMGDRGGQQQGRPDAAALAGQNQGGNNPKAPFTTTVMRGADADEATGPMRSGRGDSARYA